MGPPIIISENYKDVTISWYKVVVQGDYQRLFFGQMEHSRDFHLYHNVMSFVWKGYFNERAMGFKRFLSLMIVLIISVGVGTCFAQYIFSFIFTSADPIYNESLGFQGVIFALKMVMSQFDPARDHNYGAFIQAGSWFELVLSSLFNSYSSMANCAVGIAVGYEYANGYVMKNIVGLVEAVITFLLELTGFAEDIERAADNWNEQDDGNVNAQAGRGGMFGMGMGGMGMGMGGMGGMFGPRR